jgi:hypothetical protein
VSPVVYLLIVKAIALAGLHSLLYAQPGLAGMFPTPKALFKCTLLSLLLAGCAAGQAGAELPRLNILLPANIPADKFEVRYYLYGSFGANGGYISPTPDTKGVAKIPLSVGGKIANEIKLFAWAPGCRFQTYDLSVHESDMQELYTCNPLSTVTLHGQIADKSLLQRGPTEIRIDYLAGWACNFFGLSDCMVPQVSLGTVTADADGRFEIELPDFAEDPASSDPKSSSEFQFVLRKVTTWKLIAFLDPDLKVPRSGGGGLRPAPSYADPLVFSARKTN